MLNIDCVQKPGFVIAGRKMEKAPVYYRLVTLWIISEAMLGGIIHGFRIPVSGLVVGSCAVGCICLIAWYVPQKGAIIKATIIVAIFKMILSPHTPAPAYIAVFFQGFMGEMLFYNRRFFRLSCIVFAALALMESALQRIIVLTIIYGNDLWTVVNAFFKSLIKQKVPPNYSFIIGTVYVLLHIITGVLVGSWISSLPERIEKWQEMDAYKVNQKERESLALPTRKKRQTKWVLVWIWIALIALYIQSYSGNNTGIMPANIAMKIFVRSMVIVLTWVLVVGPLLTMLLQRWLGKKKTQHAVDIQAVANILPGMQQLLKISWQHTADFRGLKRFKIFLRYLLVNTLTKTDSLVDSIGLQIKNFSITILTGEINSGKTTSIQNWSEGRTDVFGIAAPKVEGRRVFLDMTTNKQFDMEAQADEQEIVEVGRYRFSAAAFEKACAVILRDITREGWLVIDEIGPLEMNGKGFHEILKQVIATRKGKTLLVVRNREEVLTYVQNLVGPIPIHITDTVPFGV